MVAGLAAGLLCGPAAWAQAPAQAQPEVAPPKPNAGYPEPNAAFDGDRTYRVSRFLLEYEIDNPEHPPVGELIELPVVVGVLSDGGYTYPRAGVPVARIRVGDFFGDQGAVFYPAGIRAVTEALANELKNNRKIMGVFVFPNFDDIDGNSGEDKRKDRLQLRLRMYTANVSEPPQVIHGQDPDPQGTRLEMLERIRFRSPVNAGNVMRQDLLDDYILRLNRHPGRRIDAALAPSAERPGEVQLQYLVAEAKPWSIYANVSNTGTKATDEWRERFGFTHNQLTGVDDILQLDFVTASFSGTNALLASYERPLFDETIRGRVYGSWSQFDASQFAVTNASFTGELWTVGVEGVGTIAQDRELFLDLVGGVRVDSVEVNNELVFQEGREQFLVPYIGLRAERNRDDSMTTAGVTLEIQEGSLSGVDENELANLGRLLPDEDWTILKYDLAHSFYIEPLIHARGFQEKDDAIRGSTLAHEIFLSVRGQYAFGNRLISSSQGVAGGFYTVRGYEEALTAGDSTFIGTLEYRFHLPRTLMTVDKDGNAAYYDPTKTQIFGEPFRYGPARAWDRTDWDLIFRGFVDVGRTLNSDRQVFEKDQTLLGAGVGAEFQFKNNFQLRLDWGFALEDINDAFGQVIEEAGESRIHFSATILY